MDAKKFDVLNKIFLTTFDNVKKNLGKKEPLYLKLKTAYTNIKENHPDSQTNEGIRENLNLLISILENKLVKITEKALNGLDQIISTGQLEIKILQEKVPSILENLFSKSNMGDDNINYKILNLCLVLYTNKNLKINGMSLINLIKICLNVFLLTKNSNCQNAAKSTLIQILDLIIEKVENSINASNLLYKRNNSNNNTTNNNVLGNFSNKLVKINNTNNTEGSNILNTKSSEKRDSKEIEFKTALLNKNDFGVNIQHKKLMEKYMNFYLDVLEIDNYFKNSNSSEENNNINVNFLEGIKELLEKPEEDNINLMENEEKERDSISSNSNSFKRRKSEKSQNNNNPININETKYLSIKQFFENFKLENSKLKNELSKPIGRYGWCINCRNKSIFFSDRIYYPICTNECEKEIQKLTNSIKSDLNANVDEQIQIDENNSKNPSNYISPEVELFREDYINTVKILSKLSIKELKQQSNIEEINLRLRELCLELIQILLIKGAKYFRSENKLLQVVKECTIDSLVKNTMSNEMNIFKLSVSLFLTIISYYRENLKIEMEIFINKVLIAILESENLGFIYKEIILDALLKIADNGNFLVEIYTNYDCDINHKNVFYDLINLMTKIINGLYKKPKYSNTFKNNQEAALRIKCLEFLSNFIKSLSLLVEENNNNEISNNNNNNYNINNYNNYNNQTNFQTTLRMRSSAINFFSNSINKDGNQTFNTEQLNNQSEFYSNTNFQNIDEELNISTIDNDIKDKINFNLKLKSIISKAVEKFNFNPSSAFNFLKAHDLLPTEKIFNEIIKRLIQENEMISESAIEGANNNTNNFDKDSSNAGNNNYNNLFFNLNNNLSYLNDLDKEELQNITYDQFYAKEISVFLKTNLKEINKEKLGEFLCGSKPFNQKVLENFVDSYSFKNFHILEAMRALFSDFNLVGEGQIVDRVVKFFGQKYYKDNPLIYKIPDVAYYLAFSIMLLQTDLHRSEVDKKMSPQVFINNFNLVCKDGVEEEYLVDVYNRVLNDPLRFPGQKFSMNKNKKDLIKLEKESILKSTYEELHIKNFGNNPNQSSIQDNFNQNYITAIDNDHIRNLLDSTWSNFLGIFSQLLADFEEENIVTTCIDNILLIGRMCGILGLETISEAFINTIINITNIMEGREIKRKNFACTKAIIEFSVQSGNFIRSSWYNILTIVSKLEYYHAISGQFRNEAELFAKEIRRKSKSKYPEKEIEIEARNTELISNNISMIICDNIFSKTSTFDLDGITSFISALCLVSKNELDNFFNPRNYSLHKLVEVADFNIFRIQIEWSKIWKLISDHLVFVATNFNHDNICIDAIDSLRQTVTKLLQKTDLLMAYNFQIEFFRPFEIIFSQSINRPDRSELILTCLAHIVQNSKNINSGWIIIFNILKSGMKRKDQKLNNEILRIFQIINDDFSLMNNNNINHEVFRGYIECLCHMYLDENLKKLAFETIIKLITKIFNNKSNENFEFSQNHNHSSEDGKNVNMNLIGSSNEKRFEFLKIFFYGFDDLLRINVIEHVNLLFEVISYNKDFIFSSDINSFIYLYFSYFKPHIVSLILNYYDYPIGLFANENESENNSNNNENNTNSNIDNTDREKLSNNQGSGIRRFSKDRKRSSMENSNNKIFEEFNRKNSLEDIYHNIKTYLENSLSVLIINLEEESNLSSAKNLRKKSKRDKEKNQNNQEDNTNAEKEKELKEKEENLPRKIKSGLFELNNNGGGDSKLKIIQFLKQMLKCYDKDTDLIIKKLEVLKHFNQKNYEVGIEFFIEKFFNMIHSNSDTYMNYKFFFEDLLNTIFNLSTFNKYPNTLFKIIGKNILFNGGIISENCWNYLMENISYKLKTISNLRNNIPKEHVGNIINFLYPFSNLMKDLFLNYFDKLELFSNDSNGLVNEYNYINLIFSRFLKNDILFLGNKSEKNEKEKNEVNSNYSQILEIVKVLQKIKYLILEKTNFEPYKFFDKENFEDLLKTFDSLYEENRLYDCEDNEIIGLIHFEINQILPRFLKYLTEEELKYVFSIMITFVDSRNSTLRNSAKFIIKQFISNDLICFRSALTNKDNENKEN